MADLRPGDPGYLKWYWTVGPGRAKWATWTELYNHLKKHMDDAMAKRVASQWFHDATGMWSGEQRGKNPSGPG